MSKEPARTDKKLIALNAGGWELEVTASPAVQVGRTSTARAVLCPQDTWTFVTYVSRLQAANGEPSRQGAPECSLGWEKTKNNS